MRKQATKGTCVLCHKEYSKAGMSKQLIKCLAEQTATAKGKKCTCFLLQVSARYTPAYWLQLQADAQHYPEVAGQLFTRYLA